MYQERALILGRWDDRAGLLRCEEHLREQTAPAPTSKAADF